MSYIKELEQQNEELKQKLANAELLISIGNLKAPRWIFTENDIVGNGPSGHSWQYVIGLEHQLVLGKVSLTDQQDKFSWRCQIINNHVYFCTSEEYAKTEIEKWFTSTASIKELI